MFYRSLLAAIAAVVIASPVFAEDTSSTTTGSSDTSMQTSDSSGAASSTSEQQTKVNLNTATAKDLMKVKGLNASKARAIVAYRKKNGDFKSVDDLVNVKGSKKWDAEKLKQVTDQLTIE